MRKLVIGSRLLVLTTFAGVIIAAAVAAACGSGTNNDLSSGGAGGTADGGSTLPGNADAEAPPNEGINTTGVGAGTGAATGLPCDVQQLLENRCIGCHLATSTSPPPLLTYADLLKPSSDATKNLAQKSLERMKSTTAAMPPPPAVAPDATEVAVMEKWVAAGTPMGAVCTPPAGDAGTEAGAPVTNPYNTPTICTSNVTWNQGNNGSSRMRPGGACITCHTMRGGPAYTIAGTVYPTAHEPNDCNGVNAGVTVVVTDKNGVVTNIPVNTVGNFYLRAAIAAPFNVKVVNGAKTRAMAGALTAGDCNSCHTLAGVNGAPGRIMAP
jgi:hypothetical protein